MKVLLFPSRPRVRQRGGRVRLRVHEWMSVMHDMFRAALTLALFLWAASGGATAAPLKGLSSKVRDTPDFPQHHPALPGWGRGNPLCGPTCVSNSLMWLGSSGYPDLIPDAPTPEQAQLKLIMALASPRFMGTKSGGTGPTGIIKGAFLYALECGYAIKRLEGQGWRCPKEHSRGVAIPEWRWIRSALTGKTAVWMNLGYYDHDPRQGTYTRTGGHWVTVVDAGTDSLTIHDPSDGIRPKPKGVVYRFHKVRPGKGRLGPGRSSSSYVGQYLRDKRKRNGQAVGIDAVIVMELHRRPSERSPPPRSRPLFDGRTLAGWTPLETTPDGKLRINPRAWPVKAGSVVCKSRTNSILICGPRSRDFVLEMTVRLQPGGATAIMKGSAVPGEGGFLLPLLDRAALRKAKGKRLPTGLDEALGNIARAMRPGRWDAIRVRFQGDRAQLAVNGRAVLDTAHDQLEKLGKVPRRGHIVLLNGNGDARGTAFRDIRLSELP